MKMYKVLGTVALAVGLMVCQDVSTEAANVYRVNKQGELYDYRGSSNVRIRSNTSAIRRGAFEGVKTKRFSVSGGSYFKAVDGVLYSKDGKLLVKYPTEKSGAFTVPSTVTKIADGAFKNCTKLTKVTIPSSVTSIGEACFKKATGLQRVCIKGGVETIQEETFLGCNKLVTVELPATVKKLKSYCFEDCEKLESIELPNEITYMGRSAFEDCASLKEVRCPDALRVIEDEAFYDCVNLTGVTNTAQIEKIKEKAFAHCTNLSGFVFGENINTVEEWAFANCNKLGEVKIPKGLTQISEEAFINSASSYVVEENNPNYASQDGLLMNESKTKLIQASSQNTGALNIPAGVTEIGWSALNDSRYSVITIPEGVTEVGIEMFADCNYLTTISLPATIDNVKQVSEYSYEDVVIPKLERVLIPDTNEKYRSEDGVLYTKNGGEMVFFPMGRKGVFSLPDGCKKIGIHLDINQLSGISVSANNKYYSSKDGVLYDAKGKKICGYPAKKTEYTIPKQVTNIKYLNDVKYHINICKIQVEKGNDKFSAKAGVVFSKDGTTLWFYPPEKPGKYTVPKKVTKIKTDAFWQAKKLTSLTISENVCNGGSRFYFSSCSNLKDLTIRDGKLNAFRAYFSYCNKLKKISLPSNVMGVGLWSLPEGVTVYGWDNDSARSYAEDVNGRFVNKGKVPKAVSGCRVKKVVDKYRVSWKASRGVSGYQVFTPNGSIATLSGSGKTSCLIDSSYLKEWVYIRAYRVVKGKKIYGKGKYVDME